MVYCYNGTMNPINNLVTEKVIENLASRSNLRYGKQMAQEDSVTFIKHNSHNIVAEVKHGNSEKRTVQLISTPKGLRWKCTCTSKKDLFCNHCVAVALSAIK